MTYNVSSSRVWVCIAGSSPARTRHSTTAQSPPDCSPASLSSVLVPAPWVTVRPAPGPERTGSLRAMVLLLDWERISMERPRAPSINRRSRSRHRFHESAGGGPGPDHLWTPDSTITPRCKRRLREPCTSADWTITFSCRRQANRNNSLRDETDREASRVRTESLAGQHQPGDARLRAAPTLHRRILGDRTDLQPVDLRQSDRIRRI